VQSPEKV
jgi:hypothetical protein